MRNHPPCIAWAEKLALRREDLSPADCAALDAHIQTCPACEAVQADYHFLDAQLRALPPPALKPLPRLSPQIFTREEGVDTINHAFPTAWAAGQDAVRLGVWQSEYGPSVRIRGRLLARRGDAMNLFTRDERGDAINRVPTRGRLVSSLRRVIPLALLACLVLSLVLVFGIQIAGRNATQPPGTALLAYTGHRDYVDAVAWSPNGQYIASGSWDATVQVWDSHSGASMITYKGHAAEVSALAWSPDGQYIVSGSWDGTVRVWDVFTGETLRVYTGHTHGVSALAWSPDGQYIASGSWDHTVRVWDAHTGVTLGVNTGSIEFVNAVAWSPDGQYIASGDSNNAVLVWNPRTGTTLPNPFISYTGGILEALAWSPDERSIAAGFRDKTVRVLQAFTGRLLYTYQGHTGEVSALAWSPNSQFIASGSADHTVRVWNVHTGATLFTYTGHSNTVDALAWSPNGRYIASGSWDDTVQIWVAPSTR